MKEYRCSSCCFHFESKNELPYCPACDCENIEDITFDDDKYIKEDLEEHHIHPRFMNNEKGYGQKYLINEKTHSILHGKIMNWIWEEIPIKYKKIIIDNIIIKSKKFLGVSDDK